MKRILVEGVKRVGALAARAAGARISPRGLA